MLKLKFMLELELLSIFFFFLNEFDYLLIIIISQPD